VGMLLPEEDGRKKKDCSLHRELVKYVDLFDCLGKGYWPNLKEETINGDPTISGGCRGLRLTSNARPLKVSSRYYLELAITSGSVKPTSLRKEGYSI